MTNSEYEKACVQEATGESLVRAADEKIKELESALEVARERRRELVNRYDLNREQYKKRCDEVVLSRGAHNRDNQSN